MARDVRARRAPSRPRRVYTRRLVPVLRMIDIDMVAKATLNGEAMDARLVDAITNLELDLTMDGANQLSVTVEDVGGDLLRAPLLRDRIDLAIPGAGRWRMNLPRDVGGLSIAGTSLTLRFWDIGSAALQERFEPMRKSARSTDLYGFVSLLAREVRPDVNLRVVVPAPGEIPHLEEETDRDRVGRSTTAAGSGWPPRAAAEVRVKGQRASAEQLRVMDAVFTEAAKHDPPALAMLALAAAVTVERDYFNKQGIGANSVSYGVIQAIPGTSAGVNGSFTQAQAMDIAYSVKSALLPPGPTGAGGLIRVANQNPNWTPGQVAKYAINSKVVTIGDPRYIEKVDSYAPEAKRNIELWTGRRFENFRRGGGDDGRTEEVRYRPAQWRRGTDRSREGSWKTLRRYSEQLGRRRFVAGPTTRRPVLVMAQDQQLILATPHLVVPLDDELIAERPMVDIEGRERLEQIDLRVLASGWSAPPGAVADVANGGLLDGPWITLGVRLRSGDPIADVTLTQPVTRREPDPARSRSRRRLSRSDISEAQSEGAAAAIAWAEARLGLRETGHNTGAGIDPIITGSGGSIGQAYCGYFCGGALQAAGLSVPSSIGAVIWIYESSAARRAPFRGAVGAADGSPGDLAVIGGPSQHVELVVRVDVSRQIVHTIGGNTSLPDGGEGVARKERPFSTVVRIAQVAYAT